MNTTPQDRETMLELAFKSAFKSTLESLPFGKVFSDVIFEYRGKVKEKRLLKFIENLKDYISVNNPEIDINRIQSDGFGDLFENILKKVAQTRQSKKTEGFKNILLKGITVTSEIEYCELFTEILSQINEKQIEILFVYSESFNKESISLKNRRDLDNELYDLQIQVNKEENFENLELLDRIKTLKSKSDKLKNDLKNTMDIRQASYYNLSEGEYKYFLQDLYNKSLLNDEGIGGIGTAPFEMMNVTNFGIRFLEFIRNAE